LLQPHNAASFKTKPSLSGAYFNIKIRFHLSVSDLLILRRTSLLFFPISFYFKFFLHNWQQLVASHLSNMPSCGMQRINFQHFQYNVAILWDLWDIAPYSVYVNFRFGRMYHLHLQGHKSAKQVTSM
jgi:hypothetical protein